MTKVKYSKEELNLLFREAESYFKKFPGVIGVGFGYKEKNGKITENIAFRVYVERKKALLELPDSEKIPDSYKGIKTDVIISFEGKLLSCEDTQHHDPIVAGITITVDDILFDTGGTLGCLTTLNGETSKDNVGILSNKHVLDGGINTSVYHPFFDATGTSVLISKSKNEGVIAKIYNAGTASNVNFHYPGDSDPTEYPYYLDCALARVTTSYSSCCPTNCGTKYNPVIEQIGPILGVSRVQASDIDPVTPYIVRKRGRRTGLTSGKVVEVNATYSPATPKHGVILVEPIADNCEGLRKFADHGDSGSVIVNANDEVIGLLFSIPDVPDTSPYFGYGIVCHIHPVLDFLNTTIIVTPEPSDEQRYLLETKNIKLKSINDLKDSFINKNEFCKELYSVFERYRGEVVQLVNHHRPVTVVWHRNFGPQFVAHFIKNFNDPDYKVPTEINNVSLQQLLKVMRKALAENSSKGLKAAIDQFSDQIIEASKDCEELETLLSKLSNIEQATQ
ncbi:MAG TPA: hypothetical protein VLQ91_01760 [Draconibacterium sp.]|nr:hypothetical protein [Draconibacterium sp.]